MCRRTYFHTAVKIGIILFTEKQLFSLIYKNKNVHKWKLAPQLEHIGTFP